MLQVPSIEQFNDLVTRIERVEKENDFLKELLTGKRWITRSQAMTALGCKKDKLWQLTTSNKIAHRYEGAKPYYDLFSIRNYLAAQKIDGSEVDKRIISACYPG
ncbi:MULTISPECIES: hypothetical protein [unclassified Spirosoma]|uniref:hypothetical protein n=1 Tax=unclassified Spirosoma TaxID=2621999 RepID=UPI000964CAB4|nr:MULTISPECIES: hypothetical protein [unclassified Spirosoma]MBN8826474.1 hypothetical protein [Spirosoma sp.]OJW76433.1 MAG: hypothetical protein BGO59_23250 [Spirosoma sp. 48-14]